MTDWDKVASCIEHDTTHSSDENEEALRAAITLCRRMAKGELVERLGVEALRTAARAVPSPGFARQTKEGWSELVQAVENLRCVAAVRDENGQLEKPTSEAKRSAPGE